jgi:hypothetical protein
LELKIKKNMQLIEIKFKITGFFLSKLQVNKHYLKDNQSIKVVMLFLLSVDIANA